MSEEKPTGWTTQPGANGVKRITSIGGDPWRVKELKGTVRFKRADAGALSVTALDYNGVPTRKIGAADNIELEPSTLYYLIEKR